MLPSAHQTQEHIETSGKTCSHGQAVVLHACAYLQFNSLKIRQVNEEYDEDSEDTDEDKKMLQHPWEQTESIAYPQGEEKVEEHHATGNNQENGENCKNGEKNVPVGRYS